MSLSCWVSGYDMSGVAVITARVGHYPVRETCNAIRRQRLPLDAKRSVPPLYLRKATLRI